MTVIGDNLKVILTGSVYSYDFEHAKEITEQITALLWGLI